MSWQVLVLLSSAFAAIATILNRKAMQDKKLEPITFATVFQLTCAIILGGVGLFLGQMKIGNIVPLIPYLLLGGILYGLGNIFIFKSLKLGEASKFTVIFSTQSLFTIFGAYLFLGERLLWTHWIGVGLMIISVALISFTPDSIKFDKDELYALLAAIFFGFARVNDKFMIGQMDFYMFLFLGFLLPAIVMVFFNPGIIKHIKEYKKPKHLEAMLVVSAIYSLNAILFYLALSVGKSSQVVTAAVTAVIFTEILGVIWLGEKKNISRKVFGSILTVIGLLLISL